MICFGYIIVKIQYKGDHRNNDDDDGYNNNKFIFIQLSVTHNALIVNLFLYFK